METSDLTYSRMKEEQESNMINHVIHLNQSSPSVPHTVNSEAAPIQPMTIETSKASRGERCAKPPWWAWVLGIIGFALVLALSAVAGVFSNRYIYVLQCPAVPLKNTMEDLPYTKAGNVVIVQCVDGAKIDRKWSKYVASCVDGVWDMSISCSMVMCKSKVLQNTKSNLPQVHIGESVMIECIPHSVVIGGNKTKYKATCVDGDWDNDSSCVKSACPRTALTNSNSLPVSPNDTSVQVQCALGTRVYGNKTGYLASCINGTWDKTRNCEYPSCKELYDRGHDTSGVYHISPDGINTMQVWCEQEKYGGGWAVFQRRMDGSVHFRRSWEEYKNGFGDLKGEHWLGNDKIYKLTTDQNRQLKIMMSLPNGTVAFAEYRHFYIGPEEDFYKLNLFGYLGGSPPGDAFRNHDGQYFSTIDRDYDVHSGHNCAKTFKAGWWYKNCYTVNLNGIYGQDSVEGVCWIGFSCFNTQNIYQSMPYVEMMVRPLAD